jgi:hypothetical protein
MVEDIIRLAITSAAVFGLFAIVRAQWAIARDIDDIQERLVKIEVDVDWLCEFYGDDPDPGDDNEEVRTDNVVAIGRKTA